MANSYIIFQDLLQSSSKTVSTTLFYIQREGDLLFDYKMDTFHLFIHKSVYSQHLFMIGVYSMPLIILNISLYHDI